jgi:hypothetical protein
MLVFRSKNPGNFAMFAAICHIPTTPSRSKSTTALIE